MHCFLCVFFTVCFFTFFTSSRAFKPIAEAHWKLQKMTDLRLWKLILFSGCFKQTHRTSRNSTSLHIYIYISISIPLESSLGQVFPHCLNMIHIFCKTLYEWTPPKLQIDAKNDCLENALPFKHAMLGELFNHVHLSAPSKMRKKHGKNEKSHVFQEQPRAQLRWLENLTTSQYLRRR